MKKTYSIIIIVLTLILTAINVWLFAERSQDDCKTTCIVAKESGCYLTKTLSLTDNQKEKYEQIKQKYQFQAILAADSLHINQERLMGELMRNTSDSIQLKQLEEKVAECQGKLLHLSVEQYFEIKKILNPNQIPALDSLFAHILICRPTCNHRDGDGGTIPHLN